MKKKINSPRLTADLRIKKAEQKPSPSGKPKIQEKETESVVMSCPRCPFRGTLPKDWKCPVCRLYLGDLVKIKETEGI